MLGLKRDALRVQIGSECADWWLMRLLSTLTGRGHALLLLPQHLGAGQHPWLQPADGFRFAF